MADSFLEIRERLHQKSHDYFMYAQGRWDRAKRRMFYGATDALLDASQAASSYRNAISSDVGANLLVCHGFLQALYVQQDAVATLLRAVGLAFNPNDDARLKEIRDARNRLTGHPALAGEHEKPRRPSSAIIPYSDISREGFRGHVYYESESENINVEVAAYQADNEARLALQMLLVEKRMDEEERQFRARHGVKRLSTHFEGNLEYLIRRLWCELDDEGRVGQARAHAEMIRERIERLERDLKDRGFASYAGSLEIVFTGIELLQAILDRDSALKRTQDEYDLVFAGLEVRFRSLIRTLADLDAELSTPVS